MFRKSLTLLALAGLTLFATVGCNNNGSPTEPQARADEAVFGQSVGYALLQDDVWVRISNSGASLSIAALVAAPNQSSEAKIIAITAELQGLANAGSLEVVTEPKSGAFYAAIGEKGDVFVDEWGNRERPRPGKTGFQVDLPT